MTLFSKLCIKKKQPKTVYFIFTPVKPLQHLHRFCSPYRRVLYGTLYIKITPKARYATRGASGADKTFK